MTKSVFAQKLSLHKPHPRPELKKYQVEQVRAFFEGIGVAPEA